LCYSYTCLNEQPRSTGTTLIWLFFCWIMYLACHWVKLLKCGSVFCNYPRIGRISQ
jgi:hypothetical protein